MKKRIALLIIASIVLSLASFVAAEEVTLTMGSWRN